MLSLDSVTRVQKAIQSRRSAGVYTKGYSSALMCLAAFVGSLENTINMLRRHTRTCASQEVGAPASRFTVNSRYRYDYHRSISSPAHLMTSVDKIKATPLDIEAFRQETSVKYPTFAPPNQPLPLQMTPPDSLPSKPNPPLFTLRLAQAYSPIPIRHHYHHDDSDSAHPGLPSGHHTHFSQHHPSGYRPNPQPATPAPSPPPSPKAKKQQYQTDQTRPFLFPFSRTRLGRGAKLVPFAIDEADRLYSKHMYVSLSLWQMWRTREDCMTAESGLEHLPGSEGEFPSSTFTSNVSGHTRLLFA